MFIDSVVEITKQKFPPYGYSFIFSFNFLLIFSLDLKLVLSICEQ